MNLLNKGRTSENSLYEFSNFKKTITGDHIQLQPIVMDGSLYAYRLGTLSSVIIFVIRSTGFGVVDIKLSGWDKTGKRTGKHASVKASHNYCSSSRKTAHLVQTGKYIWKRMSLQDVDAVDLWPLVWMGYR